MSKSKEILNVENLESTQETGRLSKSTNTINYSSREWLEANDPAQFHTPENVTPKYELERENRVADGLSLIESFVKNGVIEINPLTILLAKWWEVKPARNEIKKMIDAEATSKDIDTTDYMQEKLAGEVDLLKNVQTAIDRARYAVTYFKPRVAKSKVVMKNLKIGDVFYQVPETLLAELKEKHGSDTKKISAYIVKNCAKTEIEEL